MYGLVWQDEYSLGITENVRQVGQRAIPSCRCFRPFVNVPDGLINCLPYAGAGLEHARMVHPLRLGRVTELRRCRVGASRGGLFSSREWTLTDDLATLSEVF
jgi:hypothetical protein